MGWQTCSEEAVHAQEAERDPHDGGLVQVGGDFVWEGQGVGELVEDLRLLAPPTPGRIPRPHLPLVRAGPGEEREGRKGAAIGQVILQDYK